MHTIESPLPVPRARGPVQGRVELPGSKSYTNRALPIAALANGKSTIDGVLDSDDTRYMCAALAELGFEIESDWENGRIQITGREGLIPASNASLFLGNSGTSMRFLTAFVALGSGEYTLDGVERMRERPIGPLLGALNHLGVDATSLYGNDCPPIQVRSQGLPGSSIQVPGNLSSQYFSALAMVIPCAHDPVTINVEGELVSKPYLDMTGSAMRAFGVELLNDNYESFTVAPGSQYQARNYSVEPDASTASYFFALAAATCGSITVANLPPDTAQGDIHFVDILEEMGCNVERSDEITVTGPQQLRGLEVDMNAVSDTVMTLAAIAPFADGPVKITNVEHIRYKETDRLEATRTELERMGIRAQIETDSITIFPGTPSPATIETYDDHRIAMSFAITAAASGNLKIAGPGCVAKTVPRFWDLLMPLLEG